MPSTSRPDPLHGARRGERIDLSDAYGALHDEPADDDAETPGLPDYYARLGVTPDVTPEEMRRAYHRLVKLWHPDRYTGAPEALHNRAERRMRLLNEAYDTLSDPVSRATYDRQRAGHSAPIGDVINVFGQRSSVTASAYAGPYEEHASANPNGAGQFFGMLAAILALALIGGAISGATAASGIGALIVLLGIIGLLVAATFFVTDSPLAKWAFHAMEAEPRGSSRHARRAEHSDERATPPPAEPAADTTETSKGPLDAATFDALIDEALTAVPHTFEEYMRNVVVQAEQEPDAETLRRAGVPEGHTLLGLYHGVSLTRQGAGAVGPEIITIYRGPIERYCRGDLERIRQQVRATVLHELAHHFGINHDEMPEWVK